jgi:hypothetical protein
MFSSSGNWYLPYIFAGNFLLVIIDASIGYHVAPLLLNSLARENESGNTVGGVRMLLAGVVTLYMFFSCLAFFNNNKLLLLIVTGIILLDIFSQLFLKWKFNGGGGE